MTGFDWRQQGSAAPSASTEQSDSRAGYQLLKIWIPEDVPNLVLGPDQWQPVREIRFGADEKAFLHGFTSLLGLSARQEWLLLDLYAKQYQQALSRAGTRQSRQGIANRAANAWIRAGAKGFLVRE